MHNFDNPQINPYYLHANHAAMLRAMAAQGVDISGVNISGFYNIGQVPGLGLPQLNPVPQLGPQPVPQGMLAQALAQGNPQLGGVIQGGQIYNGFGQGVVQMAIPRQAKGVPIGFDTGAVAIAAGATTSVSRTPQKPFAGSKLAWDAATAAAFNLRDLTVANVSQLGSPDAVPCSAFIPNADASEFFMDTCDPGCQIVLEVENISAAASRTRASITGTYLR